MHKKQNSGFTLIELAIVSLFLGLLAIFAIVQFSGSALDNTKAVAIRAGLVKIADNWALLQMHCNLPLSIATSTVGGSPASASNNLSMLLGTKPVDAAYQSCYDRSGLKALSGLTTGSVSNEKIQNYKLSVADGSATRTLQFTLEKLPSSLVLILYNKYSSVPNADQAISLPAQDTTNDLLQFSTESGGTRTVYMVLHY